uniref:Uncharacterized protein n=1 Tax=Avena sativa TaxID=4498 RepID=A0ACD5VAY0_AVESA
MALTSWAFGALWTVRPPVLTSFAPAEPATVPPSSRRRRRHTLACAMLRLRSSMLAHLISSPATSPGSSVPRLLSAAAPSIPPNPSFAVDDYLVGTCGLTPAQALKASAKLSHLKSPTKPDAVLTFLAGLGLSGADIAAAVAKDPKLLCVDVEKTMSPIIAGLSGHGLSHTEIARLVSLGHTIFRCRSVVSNLQYYMTLFGSIESGVRFLKNRPSRLGCSLEKVVKPNVAFLRKCGLRDCDISKLCHSTRELLSASPERIQAMVACAESLGVPRGSGMFRQMLHVVACLSEEKIAVKMECMKNTFRWSDAEVGIAVCKAPMVLARSKDTLQRKAQFLISEVGLEPAYIAHRSSMLGLSLEGRLRPRYYILKFLKENGLLKCDRDYYSTLMFTEKVFLDKFICPHKEAAPYLAEDYAAACRGELTTRFKLT